MTTVLDASVALALCFRDEHTDPILELALSLADDPARAPSTWPLEVSNGLLMAERRGRLNGAEVAEARIRLLEMPVAIEDPSLDIAIGLTLVLAREHNLTVYDAAYLEIAMREGLPLATLDSGLRAAAERAGVELAL